MGDAEPSRGGRIGERAETRPRGRKREGAETPRGGRKAERAETTRAALVAVARQLFAERGYAGVGTEEIVKRARVTRGALYHHFKDKRDLFRAVHDDLERRLAEGLGERLAAAADQEPLDLLATGVRAFLDACLDRGLTQIALIDAPSVLGWEEWREIDMKYGMGLVSFGLQQAMDRGAIRPQPVRPLAHLMLGALGEAGMVIATAEEPEAARAEVEQAVLALLAGLRA